MAIKQLWAPWRMEFILENKEKGAGCVFCQLLKEKDDRKNLILHRAERVYVILNKYPYNNGHLMVVPNRHAADLGDYDEEELKELLVMGRHGVKALGERYQPEGFNVGMNLGVSGGAGIKDHLHLHIVPRWMGDTNFMPVLAETKSMPQHLGSSYDELSNYFKRL